MISPGERLYKVPMTASITTGKTTAEDVKDNDTATNGFVDSYLLCFISFFWGIIYKRAGESLSVLDGTKYGNYTVFMRYSFDIQ